MKNSTPPFIFSFLDHLVGDVTKDTFKVGHQALKQLCANISRDLENLLNTKLRCVGWPKQYDELDKSPLNYGITDFMGIEVDTESFYEQLCRFIENAISVFEKRLGNVTVSYDNKQELYARCIKLKIDGVLKISAYSEAIAFDVMLNRVNQQSSVKIEMI